MKKRAKTSPLGEIVFGKSRPAPKSVEIDITLDDIAMRELPKLGLELIKKDKEALINYAIVKSLESIAGVQ